VAPVLSHKKATRCSTMSCRPRSNLAHLRRRRLYAATTSTVAALVTAALVVPGGGLIEPAALAATTVQALAGREVQQVNVPAADLVSVGIPGGVSAPILLPDEPVLTMAGKVEVAYVGGGWCPYCTLGNWPLQIALSQFGTFSQLGASVSSSSSDIYPGLKAWSFTGSRYVSKYFKLDAFETSQKAFQSTSSPYPSGLGALVNKYDRAPYAQSPGGIPFTDLGDHFLVIGSPTSPAPLMHLSQAQVAAALRRPTSVVARAVDGAANYLVAAMCLTPGASSATICASRFAQRIDASWASSFPTTTTTSTTTTTVPATTTTSTTTTTVPPTTTSSTTTTTSALSTTTTTTT